jgi:hypothetical protein
VFEQLLIGHGRPHYDIAAMKFCYVDLGRDTGTEVSAMLDRYTRVVNRITHERPDVQLLHITMPLQSDTQGRKARLKRALRMSLPSDADNVLRNAFNIGLRERYKDAPMFDLAAVESTLPDGSRSAFVHRGAQIYTLAPGYTDDGGHLIDSAQRIAAMKFADALASSLREVRAAPGSALPTD